MENITLEQMIEDSEIIKENIDGILSRGDLPPDILVETYNDILYRIAEIESVKNKERY